MLDQPTDPLTAIRAAEQQRMAGLLERSKRVDLSGVVAEIGARAAAKRARHVPLKFRTDTQADHDAETRDGWANEPIGNIYGSM